MRLKYPLEVFFECIKCGLCCRDTEHHRRKVFLTPRDVENIVSLTRKSPREFCRATHAAPIPFSRVIKKTSGSCPFLDEDSMCTIYDSRPLICRCYPFIVDYEGKDFIAFTASSKECPGLGRRRRLPEEFFEKLAQEVARNFESCEKLRLDSR